jgi:hypothetical protein
MSRVQTSTIVHAPKETLSLRLRTHDETVEDRLRDVRGQLRRTAFAELDTTGVSDQNFVEAPADRQVTVVKNVLSEEQAASYVDEAYAWLESFGLGFDRHDPNTWHVSNVPAFVR